MQKKIISWVILVLAVLGTTLVYTHFTSNKTAKATGTYSSPTLNTKEQKPTLAVNPTELPPKPLSLLYSRQMQHSGSSVNLTASPVQLTGISETSTYNSSFPSNGVPILMYHSISSIPGNNLGVPPQNFAAQMKYLHDTGFTSISLDDLYNALNGKGKLPKRPMVITFDDGYGDNYTAAFPVLKQYGFRATFFVITAAVNSPGMLSWDQLREMQSSGMSIESHTVHHLDLSTLSARQQRSELAGSQNKIQSQLSLPVNYFCYPSGKYNSTTLLTLKSLGYKGAVTTVYGRVRPGANPYELKRIRISGFANLPTFIQQINS